jgi:hypothetical protein
MAQKAEGDLCGGDAMADEQGSRPIRFGIPQEEQDFLGRNSRFMEVLPRLEARLNQILIRTFETSDAAQKVVFFLGRLIAEDFHEILLVCANGYGHAGLKLIRPMFEATVTAFYLMRHPEEAEAFLEYDFVHQRKGLKIAESVGVDLSEAVPKDQQAKIEAKYQEIKEHYRQVCPKCGESRGEPSWTKKDLTALSREIGLAESALYLSFFATLQIHTTPTRLKSRLAQTAEGLLFKEGPQRPAADAALVGAHVCMAQVLEGHNRYFALGIDDLERQLDEDVKYAWQDRPDIQIAHIEKP